MPSLWRTTAVSFISMRQPVRRQKSFVLREGGSGATGAAVRNQPPATRGFACEPAEVQRRRTCCTWKGQCTARTAQPGDGGGSAAKIEREKELPGVRSREFGHGSTRRAAFRTSLKEATSACCCLSFWNFFPL